jgi:hypothetical protein
METKKYLSWSMILLLALGILAFFLETEFNLPNGIRLGVGLLGAACIVWGVEELINHRVIYSFFWQGRDRQQSLMTMVSISASLSRFLIGSGLLAISLLGFFGAGSQAADFIRTRPGIALLFSGVLGLTLSIQQLFKQGSPSESLQSQLERIFQRFFGAVLALLSMALLAVGMVEIFRPDLFKQVLNTFLVDSVCLSS